MCQGKKGYLWFATDNGVSMFDGKRFKNFTTEDGLTDNDVIYIASDSKGRVWMMPFNKTICFYYNGKIHNPKNDSSLSTVQFSSWVVICGENNRGDVILNTTEGLFTYTAEGRLKELANYKKLGEKFKVPPEEFYPVNLNNNPMIRSAHAYSTYLFNGNRIFALGDTFFFYKTAKMITYR